MIDDTCVWVGLFVLMVAGMCFAGDGAARRGRCEGYCTALGAVCHEPGDPPVCAKVMGENTP